jgi:hypothetical protein
MSQDKAMVRELVERIEGVAATWFELEIEGASRKKTLVVEVGFDLDPNSTHFLRAACDEIERTFKAVLREENGDVISKLKIVNKARQSDEKLPAEHERRPRRGGSDADARSMNA